MIGQQVVKDSDIYQRHETLFSNSFRRLSPNGLIVLPSVHRFFTPEYSWHALADLLQSPPLNHIPPNQETWCVSDASLPSLPLSLVVPAYNEVESLALLHEKIRAAVEPLNLMWEVIYIDDGSTDRSADVMRDSKPPHPGYRRRSE